MRKLFPLAALAAVTLLPGVGRAQEARKATFEVYGFAQLDYIQDFGRVNPDYNAMLRATKVPTVDGLYGPDGEAVFSVRQSRLGVKASLPAGAHDLKTRLEFDFFGRGTGSPDSAGQNTTRLRRAYAEWGQVLGGLTASLFMDDDFWPNIVEYWGPTGMVFYRNVQLRYTFLTGEHAFAAALERPGADLQAYPEQAPDLASHNQLPDLTAQYRLTQRWGYLQLSGILRQLGYDTGTSNGTVTGFGLNASSTIKLVPDKLTLLAAVVYGEGIANYMNDATPDLAASGTVAAPSADAVPLLGLTAYLDVAWSPLLTSSFGYSTVRLTTTSLQPGGAYETGEYASANLLVHPARNLMGGVELQWAKRTDKGGASGDDFRVQFSMKGSFSSLDVGRP
jgi:hypothetical protein